MSACMRIHKACLSLFEDSQESTSLHTRSEYANEGPNDLSIFKSAIRLRARPSHEHVRRSWVLLGERAVLHLPLAAYVPACRQVLDAIVPKELGPS